MGGSGALTTYLGTAPGVGKTYAMLRAGRLRSDAGQGVVVGWVERHGRAETRAQIGDLEVLPPRPVTYGSATFPELDVEAVMASGAGVALVDELAHTVVGTTRRRWQQLADILTAGIDVMTTANLANLVSVRDYVAQLTGAGTVESVPDEFVRSGEIVSSTYPPMPSVGVLRTERCIRPIGSEAHWQITSGCPTSRRSVPWGGPGWTEPWRRWPKRCSRRVGLS